MFKGSSELNRFI